MLFNGNLLTERKKIQFKSWVELINLTYETNYCLLPHTRKVSLQTAWLSGFLEGDGGFWASPHNVISTLKDGSLSYRIRMKFYITQKDELQLLIEIKNLFNISNSISQITNGHTTVKYNRFETGLLESHQQVKCYLKSFPFLGQRNILIKRWGRLIDYRVKKYPITEKSIIKLKRLISATKNK